MKRNKFSTVWAACLLLAGSLSITGCNNEADLDTNQYQETVALNAYGPLPVLRGGTLRFLGSNLDQIASIELPGAAPITSIEVVKGGIPSEIRITVPHDDCQKGAVVLVAKDGTRIEAKTHITYLEGLDPAHITIPASARPGETIRITVPESGDEYLDMVHMVEFAKGVQVSEKAFTAHSRYVIELAVPENAQTGKLNLYTADITDPEIAETVTNYQIITTETVLEIETPTATKVSSPRGDATADGVVTVKQGETLQFTGSLFNLVESVKIGSLVISDLDRESASAMSLVVPAEAADETVYLVCTSGIEVPVATLLTVAPSEVTASPEPVKAGQALTLSGKDMDVVVSVEFPNGGTLSGDAIAVFADKVVVNAVPSKATDGAPVKLHMANGKSVEAVYRLVVPVITAYSVNPVSAGSPIEITGTDLDLVAGVAFGAGEVALASGDVTATAIQTVVPMEATSGKPAFKLANGTQVEGPELKIEEAVFCYITELPDEENKPDAGSIVCVPVKNGDKLVQVTVDGTPVNFVFDEKNSTLTFGIPIATGSTGKVKLISSNGEVEYNLPVKPATEVEKVVFVGPVSIDWSSNRIYVEDAAMEGVPETAVMHMEFTQHEAWGQVQINYADWSQIPFEGTENGYLKTGTFNDKSVTEIDLPLTPEILANIKEKSASRGEGHSIIIQGSNWTINKISFKWENSLEKDVAGFVTNMNGSPITYPYALTWGDNGRFRLSKDLLLNEFKVKKGSKLRVYKAAGNTGQVQINNSSWTALYYLKDWAGDVEMMEQEFDDVLMEAVMNGGLVIQGGLPGITKIAILP
ncbi:MAG: hypothetical protein IJ611_09575 [Bacteroidales bacterium]|nr:hypothetical protein [Bacteroidales bacterium]